MQSKNDLYSRNKTVWSIKRQVVVFITNSRANSFFRYHDTVLWFWRCFTVCKEALCVANHTSHRGCLIPYIPLLLNLFQLCDVITLIDHTVITDQSILCKQTISSTGWSIFQDNSHNKISLSEFMWAWSKIENNMN